MDDNAKKILAGGLSALAFALLIKLVFFSGDDRYDINSDDPKERMAAIEDYRRDKSASSREVLIRVAETDTDEQVKIASIYAMRANRGEDTEQSLRRMALEDRSPTIRGEALTALGDYKNFSTTELTTALRSDSHPAVRMGAAKGLANRADRSSAPHLFAALSDPDEQVRAWAITGIRQITKVGFLYDSTKTPREQVQVIQQIGNYLRRNGFM